MSDKPKNQKKEDAESVRVDANVICQTLSSADNEATRSPYWLILDPQQNMSCDIHVLAGQIAGPFFSRGDAEAYLKAKRYHYSERARVYCNSGYYSYKYDKLCQSIGI